jgi:predicted dehydrogenase
MSTLRIGVAGLGHLGTFHVKCLSQISGAALTAVYDIDADKAGKIAAEHGIASAASYDALLDDIDAISIAAPTSKHFELAAQAMEQGIHVFIEKPIAESVEQARAMNRLAEKHAVMLQVGHIERFNPAIVALDAYQLDPMFVESHRLSQFNPRGTDVAVVLDLMIHDIDIILSLVRSDVESIDASGLAVVSETADIANARIRFKNGCVANITASRISQNKMRKMRLFQRNAYISVDFLLGSSEVFRLVDPGAADVTPTYLLGMIEQGTQKRNIIFEQPPVPKDHNPLRHELQLFVNAVNTGTRPIVDGVAAQRALEVAETIVSLIS